LYSLQLGEEFHRESLVELCRVAREVRIFPLLTLAGERSPYVDDNVTSRREAGYAVTIERVDYEFQRGGNQMLRVKES
jgi:hypothetical protein